MEIYKTQKILLKEKRSEYITKRITWIWFLKILENFGLGKPNFYHPLFLRFYNPIFIKFLYSNIISPLLCQYTSQGSLIPTESAALFMFLLNLKRNCLLLLLLFFIELTRKQKTLKFSKENKERDDRCLVAR